MREIFLGKVWHWVLLAAIAALLWWAGDAKLHVIHFNTFILSILAGSVVVILLVVRTTKPGEQVTRDKLEEDSENASEDLARDDERSAG